MHYNIEIQRSNEGAEVKRARYHSSMLDAKLTPKATKFADLPESYVIFITEHDVMGQQLPLYTVERRILETDQAFGDGTHIYYVNGAYRGDTPLGRLMHDFFCTKAQDMHYAALANKTRYFKETREGAAKMSKILEEFIKEHADEFIKEHADAIRLKGRQEGKEELLKQMLADGVVSAETLARYAQRPI